MKKIIQLLFVGASASLSCFGQQKEHQIGIERALNLYQQEKYLESADAFREAVSLIEKEKIETTHFYNWACSQAMAGKVDEAFANLNYIAFEREYANYNHLLIDPDLEALHSDQRWKNILEQVKTNKNQIFSGANQDLIATLDEIYREDQYYRTRIDRIQKEYGWESEEMSAHLRKMEKADSLNLIKVKAILEHHRWPASDEVGKDGSRTLFLVIQHADLKTQQRYLPLMKEAVKRGELHAANLAMLEDRMAIRKGEPQIYGTQLQGDPSTGKMTVSPIADLDNVDKRRTEVDLPPMKDYLIQFGLEWDLEEFKKSQNRTQPKN